MRKLFIVVAVLVAGVVLPASTLRGEEYRGGHERGGVGVFVGPGGAGVHIGPGEHRGFRRGYRAHSVPDGYQPGDPCWHSFMTPEGRVWEYICD